jgi:HPt (histidine-containing phosphotransfer) domain-containing protein
MAGIHRGYAAQNCPAVYIAAHNLMSSSRTLGALELAKLANDLESMAQAKLLVCAETLVSAVDQEFLRVCEALEKLIPAPADSGHI